MEIKPVSSQPILEKINNSSFVRGYTPCGPYIENTETDHYWQVVWAGYWGPIDPAQQLFEVQGNVYFRNFVNNSNGPFDVQILEGAEYCSFQECIPEDAGCRWTDMSHSILTDISGNELIGNGDLMFFDCVPRYVDQTFLIRYHYLDQDTATVVYSIHSERLNQTKYFHTLIVKRPFILSEMNETVEIPHAEKQYFTPRPVPVFCSSLDSSSYYADYDCKGIVFSAGGGFPDSITFNVSIVEGEEYGTMLYFDSYNNKTEGNSFSNIDEYTYNSIYFLANGIEPEDTGKVKIHISTTDPGIPETDVNIKVIPNQNYPIRVTFIPAVLAPGDTADILLEKRISDYPFSDPDNVIYESFSADQVFDVRIEKGSQYGTLLNTASLDTSYEFNDIEQGFKFIAADRINLDTAKISIRISTIIDNGGIIAASIKRTDFSEPHITKSIKELNGKKSSSSIKHNWKEGERKNSKPDNDITNSIIPNSVAPPSSEGELIFGIGHTKIIEQQILLGETKYFGVKRKTDTGELKIEEIKTDYGVMPVFPASAGEGWEWVNKKSIWSDRPIDIETKGQSPIFYDKFYAKVYYKGTTKPVIHDLPDGMIRVIGRYLGKTPDNKVKLFTTQYQNFTDTLEIQVIRPDKLGDDILNITGPTKVDYVDSTYNNIDSLVVDMAGQLGIPPQFLMGIVEQESPNGLGYRYEPFSDMRERKEFRSLYPTHRYWIESEIDLGNPTIPHHNNIEDALGPINNYPGYTTVWEIFNEKNKGDKKMYTLDIYYWYRDDYWDPYTKYYYKKLKDAGLDTLVAADSSKILADTSYIIFLRDSIGGLGMKGTIAQTRIFASYGFMQLVYSSAIRTPFNYNYPNNDPDFLPEYIMIPTINIPYASKHLLAKLRVILKKVNYLEEDTWPKEHALEKTYWEAFRAYNGASDYPNKVFNHIKNNLPKKN